MLRNEIFPQSNFPNSENAEAKNVFHLYIYIFLIGSSWVYLDGIMGLGRQA